MSKVHFHGVLLFYIHHLYNDHYHIYCSSCIYKFNLFVYFIIIFMKRVTFKLIERDSKDYFLFQIN